MLVLGVGFSVEVLSERLARTKTSSESLPILFLRILCSGSTLINTKKPILITPTPMF